VVLILAIFAVVLLSILTVGITAAVRVELRASRTSLDRMQGLFLAEAGIREACAILLYDDPRLDTLQDDWSPYCDQPLDLPRQFGEGFYRVHVQDACGRIDLNQADREMLFRLTGDAQVAEAIMAWRGSREAGGGDQAYYESLPYPYRPRNGWFPTVGELLLVRGVTPGMYFGEEGRPGLKDLLTVEAISPNTDPNGQLRFGLNEFRNWGEEAFRKAVLAKFAAVFSEYDANEIGTQIWNGLTDLNKLGQQYTEISQLATVAGVSYDRIARLIDYVTADPGLTVRGLVNVNTAPLEVLALLPGSSAELAEAIAIRRESAPFASLGEFTTFLMSQPRGTEAFTRIIDHVNVKSSSFIIEAMGYRAEGRAFRTLRALVRRLPDQVVVVQQVEEDGPLPQPDELMVAASAGSIGGSDGGATATVWGRPLSLAWLPHRSRPRRR
jgi:type II secretory pathway component PulK